MYTFTWRISDATDSTLLVWLTEAITAKSNTLESGMSSEMWVVRRLVVKMESRMFFRQKHGVPPAAVGLVANAGPGATSPVLTRALVTCLQYLCHA